jgi:diguanylate cyclase (GGDEF)-like protein/PAS domain S-box-containing protein
MPSPDPILTRVLVVEDSPAYAELLKLTLRDALGDPTLLVAGDLAQAAALLGEADFDCVLLDLGLPDSEGVGSVAKLLEVRPDALIVVLTASAEERLEVSAMAAGAQDYVVKGPDAAPVVRAMRHALQRSTALRRMDESQRRYHEIVDLLQAGVWTIDADGITTFANATMTTMLGYAPEEVTGRPLADFCDEDGRQAIERNLARRREGISEHHDFKFTRRDGGDLWVIAAATPIFEDGVFVGSTAIMTDVTARRAAEERLRESESEFRFMAENATDLISRLSTDGVCLYASPASERLCGYRPDQLVGVSIYDLIHPDDAQQARAVNAALLKGPDTLEATYRLRRPDGGSVWVETRARHVCDPVTGEVAEIHALTRDITQRRAEEDLRRMWRTAFESAPIGMALVDLDGGWLEVNDALCALVGYSENELQEMTFQDITHPDDLEADLELLRALIAGEIPEYQMEKRYFTKSGEQVWAQLSVSLMLDAFGKPLHFISQVQDITERRLMQERLRELADRDPLTELWNRRRFEDELDRQISRCRRYREHAALIVLDLDGFKTVNDTYGHKAGDALLRAIAQVLQRRSRSSDTIARLGGDEFAMLLVNVVPAQAANVAEQVCAAVGEEIVQRAGSAIACTASVGIAPLDERLTDDDDVLVAADMAMYAAKAAGPGGVAVAAAPGQRR